MTSVKWSIVCGYLGAMAKRSSLPWPPLHAGGKSIGNANPSITVKGPSPDSFLILRLTRVNNKTIYIPTRINVSFPRTLECVGMRRSGALLALLLKHQKWPSQESSPP
jgi:hypothetical protein